MAKADKPPGTKGGAREGAGRKPSDIVELRRRLESRDLVYYAGRQAELDEVLWSAALGTIRRIDSEGRVYSIPPNLAAIKLIQERALGKPRQPIEIAEEAPRPDASDPTLEAARQGMVEWQRQRREKNGPSSTGSAPPTPPISS